MPLVASLASLVAAMRARVLDRGACGPLADRRVDAAARRELAGHLLAAAPMWRIVWVSSMITKAAAGWSWGLGIKNLSFVMCVAQSPVQLARHARARRRGQNASWAAHNPHHAAQGELVSLVFGVDQLVRHVENGLLEIFRLVCGSSAQAPSCWRERRRQTSWAAAAMPLGRVAACVTSPHHSLLALEPQHGPR